MNINFLNHSMITMTSLDAQTQFGTLIDTSQREPVTVTRRGRPVAVVVSYEDFSREEASISWEVAQFINKRFPLNGRAASDAWKTHFANASSMAEQTGLTEADVIRMINER